MDPTPPVPENPTARVTHAPNALDDRHRSPTRGRARRAVDELLMGAAAAMTAAVLQLALARVLSIPFSVYEWEWRSAALIWKTPWGYGMVFAPFALGLALLALVSPRGIPLRLSLTVWLTLILWALALLFPQIHGWASLVVSLAVAVQLAGVLSRREGGTRRALRIAGVASLVLGAVARPAYEWSNGARQRAAMASLRPAAAGAPNVLFLVWDTVRAASLSLHGASVATTPQLDSLAATGVTFDDAYSTAPWTLPSHASMFTGQYASASGTDFAAALLPGAPTIAEVLQQHGYATAGFTANLMATRAESGLSRGFIRYEDFTSSATEILHSTSLTQADALVVLMNSIATRRWWRILPELRKANFENNFTTTSHDVKPATEIAGNFLDWQSTLPPQRPFFAFLNFFDAHDPYRPPPEYLAQVSGPAPRTIDRYHGGIRYIDAEVGRMLAELKRRGVLDNTIVVITSDHGEQFGEHGLNLHGNSLYRQSLHVPFVLVYPPSVPPGVRVRTPVTMRDLPATALALAGISAEASGIEGRSLVPLWSATASLGSDVISEVARHYRRGDRNRNRNGPMQSVVSDSLHIIRDGNRKLEAYNIVTDGAEERDLVSGKAVSDSLTRRLDGALQRNTLRGTKGYASASPPP